MGGGLLQLIATGEQDKFLTSKPEITYFKSVYKRYSNFSMELKQQIFLNDVNFGTINKCDIKKDGDLLSGLTLYVKLGSLNISNNDNNICVKDLNLDLSCPCSKCKRESKFSWINSVGHALIEYVELEIGGYLIDRQYGEWFEIWSELTLTNEKKNGFYEMIGKKSRNEFNIDSFNNELELIIPLNFWFSKNIGLSIPLISITDHDIFLNIKFRQFSDLWISSNSFTEPTPPNIEAKLFIDYVFLDLDERKKFVSENHYYLIEQLQYNGDYQYEKFDESLDIKLNFSHPIKEIVWAIQRTDVLKRSLTNDVNDSNFTYGNDLFNFSNSLNSSNSLPDIFDSAVFKFNDQDRFSTLPSKYFRLKQSYDYHTRIPENFIYSYSFSLRPEDWQPSGSCNFSCFDNARLKLNINNKELKSNYNIKVYAINYNILVITKGAVGIGFSC